MNRLLSTLLLSGLFASGCDSNPAQVDPLGEWGGEGVSLLVTAAGGELEFDCAVGTIAPPVADPGGGFEQTGTFTLGFGGPDVEGREPDVRSAVWSGTIRGDRMSLSGHFEPDETPVGPFELRKNAEPLLRKCL